jgi:hypothetical protein
MKPHWWDEEIALYIERGVDPHKARTVTILRWLWRGDLLPLAAAIREGDEIDQSVLNHLADMISCDAPFRLKTLPLRGGGRPKSWEPRARQIALARAYEEHHADKSDERFEQIAKANGVSVSIVRQAVAAMRKRYIKKPPA